MENLIYWSMAHKIWGVKANRILRDLILNIEGKEFWKMHPKLIRHRFPGISQEMVDYFVNNRSSLSNKTERDTILRNNIKIVSVHQESYPKRLKNIHHPPALLYIRGELLEKKLTIALVGARNSTPYGKKVAENLGSELSQNGVQVISGLARGIDSYSHNGALEGIGGTIGVLGSGINVIYPRENSYLYNKMISSCNSCVISEFPLDTQPLKYNFPIRNRIISGLSDGVVIIEAGEKSGSLITAEFALEQGKEVFAVPGPITNPMSKGPHKLLKEGAKLVENTKDIFDEFGQLKFFQLEIPQRNYKLDKDQERVLRVLGIEPIAIDDIVKETEIPFNSVMAILSLLEIKGLVIQKPGRKFMTLN